MAKKKGIHYVDNKKFLQAMIEWRESWPDEENIPPVTNYIGECFLKIATHLSYKPKKKESAKKKGLEVFMEDGDGKSVS